MLYTLCWSGKTTALEIYRVQHQIYLKSQLYDDTKQDTGILTLEGRVEGIATGWMGSGQMGIATACLLVLDCRGGDGPLQGVHS